MAMASDIALGSGFTGWPAEAFELLLQLEGDPTRSFREGLRKDQQRLIRAPMIALLDQLAAADERYEDFSVWSPGRETLWGWQRQSAIIRVARKVDFALRFDLDGLWVQGAWWYADPGQADCYRSAVADDVRGSQLQQIINSLVHKGFEISGEVMTRPPRGYPRDHPRETLLRHRSLVAGRWQGSDDDLQSPAVAQGLLTTLSDLLVLMDWLADNVARASAAD